MREYEFIVELNQIGYRAKNNEANFGSPITAQVVGGTHITFELITKKGASFYMTRWPSGLPGHDDPPNALRFPHGLIQFGETMEECASRLVSEQLGMRVKHVEIAYLESYVDDSNHWHIEPGCIVELSGEPKVPKLASDIISFRINDLPDMTFWTRSDFIELIKERLPELVRKKK